ncbi:MAG: MarR family transcriptional regulator [Thermoanaerobacterales bacterium]|jgi:MarR family 2-MHQ and catechol resistance regulon transcriptional repressor|nr:MarR family transcriptional regulator [Thermoanaerobacterales bacterium]
MAALDDERLTLVGLLLESSAAVRSQLDKQLVRDTGLTLQSFELLLRLARAPGRHLRMSDLAARSGLTPSGLTRAVDRLEAAGLVARKPCPSDGRGAYTALTPAGLSTLRSAVRPHLDHVERCVTGVLSPAERAQLTALLRKVRDHVNPAAVGAIPVGPAT